VVLWPQWWLRATGRHWHQVPAEKVGQIIRFIQPGHSSVNKPPGAPTTYGPAPRPHPLQVVWDTAAYAPCHPIDLREVPADFICLSL